MFILEKKDNLINNSAGFTLVELVVSIFIIAIMTSLFLTNYHSTSKRTELKLVARKMVSDIRLAQNNSLGFVEYGDDHVPEGGWGVHITTDADGNYIIFADNDFDKEYDSETESDINKGAMVINIPEGILIKTIKKEDGSSVNELDIVFLPPDPVVYINGEENKTVEITLEENSSNLTVVISVNHLGLIDVE